MIDPNSSNEIIRRNYRLVYSYAFSLGRYYKLSKEDIEDVYQQGFIYFIEQVEKHFKPGKGKITTFFYAYVRPQMLKYTKKRFKLLSASKELTEEEIVEPDMDQKLMIKDRLRIAAGACYDSTDFAVLDNYLQGKSMKEIGLIVGLKREACRSRLRRMKKMIM